jgi:hypothetical protein
VPVPGKASDSAAGCWWRPISDKTGTDPAARRANNEVISTPRGFLLSIWVFSLLWLLASCSAKPVRAPEPSPVPTVSPSPAVFSSPAIPNLQSELLDDRFKKTNSPIGNFDFRNFTYNLPRGWQNPDGTTDFTLTSGKIAPVAGTVSDDMTDEEKAEIRQRRRIGMSYVTTKYLDMTGDGDDEAIVILKVETGGSAVPQLVYVFTWKDNKPELIWPFRTGDRADGGLKDVRVENGMTVIELFGQDRFILGQMETGRITGDEEQLCCPTHFTRSTYKWSGTIFSIQGKRLTYSITDRASQPKENLGDVLSAQEKRR